MKEFYVVQIRVNGVVIEESKSPNTNFLMIKRAFFDLQKIFFNHLKTALLNPKEFSFTGYGCADWGAKKWLDYHKEKLCNDLAGNFELVEDGEVVDSFITK